MKRLFRIRINGEIVEIETYAHRTLLDLLRKDLGLTGTKKGCDEGECGACTILLNGNPVNACLVLLPDADQKDVLTIEGLMKEGRLHPLQGAFINCGAIQCGFCTPGMILTAKALLDRNPTPTEGEIREAISGNLCRCTGYERIIEAIKSLENEREHEDD